MAVYLLGRRNILECHQVAKSLFKVSLLRLAESRMISHAPKCQPKAYNHSGNIIKFMGKPVDPLLDFRLNSEDFRKNY